MKTCTKLKNDTNDEIVDAILYKQIIGSLRYVCNIRHDTCQSVGLERRFMEKPRSYHLLEAKRILKYMHIIVYSRQIRRTL